VRFDLEITVVFIAKIGLENIGEQELALKPYRNLTGLNKPTSMV
jgi:hypothetical protein